MLLVAAVTQEHSALRIEILIKVVLIHDRQNFSQSKDVVLLNGAVRCR